MVPIYNYKPIEGSAQRWSTFFCFAKGQILQWKDERGENQEHVCSTILIKSSKGFVILEARYQ